MIIGLILVTGGLLIAIFPPLLSLIVACFLMLLGLIMIFSAYYHRKLERRFDNPVAEFIFRF
ncbi:MAG: hypothetical protein OEU36_18510 [Gammaproteobacteria bacterium]|nr:hypothetical protein [Gammaproteobacteria bacterium]